MKQIDFLPNDYRREQVRRRLLVWRCAVSALFTTLIAASAISVFAQRSRLRHALDVAQAQQQLGLGQLAMLTDLQSRLSDADAQANVLTLLRQPWPRAQILYAVLEPLPDSIALDELRIASEHSPAEPGNSAPPRRAAAKRDDPPEESDPLQAEKERLVEIARTTQNVVYLEGITNDNLALHHYLVALGQQKLFSQAELESIDRASGRDAQFRFRAKIRVWPNHVADDGTPSSPRTHPPRSG